MKKQTAIGMAKVARVTAGLTVSLMAFSGCGSAGDSPNELSQADIGVIRPTSVGGRNEVVMVLTKFITSSGGIGTRTCSGSYFAPRVVLTAAHCLENIFAGQVFVYWGDNFAQDQSQLKVVGATWVPPAVGQPSFFAKADSFEQHPQWDPTLFHPDMGAIYLDRKPPFDPLPLFRSRLDDTWIGKRVTISGWGGDSAPTPTTTSGSQVQRTGSTVVLGSPTAADYHPEDPNPGMLDPTVRSHVLKLDGHAPNSNGCFGDSGSPIIVNQFGQDYFAGVAYFTGLSCEDYSLYTRLDPFLPFLDEAYKKGGQETLIPALDCVAPNVNGGYTAYFGYGNKNGVSLTVPYGTKNQLALDTVSWRPTQFVPGQQDFVFGVDFTSSQTVTYVLAPDNSPKTTLTVNRNSVACGPAQADQVEAGAVCRALLRSGCGGMPPASECMPDFVGNIQFTRDVFPECLALNQALDACTSRVAAGVANWTCSPGSFPDAPACDAQLNALLACYGF